MKQWFHFDVVFYRPQDDDQSATRSYESSNRKIAHVTEHGARRKVMEQMLNRGCFVKSITLSTANA